MKVVHVVLSLDVGGLEPQRRQPGPCGARAGAGIGHHLHSCPGTLAPRAEVLGAQSFASISGLVFDWERFGELKPYSTT